MPNFNIIRKNNVSKTFRVAQVMSDFDVKLEHSNEQFIGNIDLPENWNIGLICGGSGTGKTTIINELFKDNIITSFNWTDDSVLDNMPKDILTKDIEKMFYAVGFGSVPSWLKSYKVLSNGEKMRVDLARAFLYYENLGYELGIVTSAKNLISSLRKKENWILVAYAISKHSKTGKIDSLRKVRNECYTARFIHKKQCSKIKI